MAGINASRATGHSLKNDRPRAVVLEDLSCFPLTSRAALRRGLITETRVRLRISSL